MKAAIVDGAGKLLYFGYLRNPKFQALLPGNTRVDVAPPAGADTWDGAAWSESAKPARAVPDALKDTPPSVNSVPALRDEINALKADLRKMRGL